MSDSEELVKVRCIDYVILPCECCSDYHDEFEYFETIEDARVFIAKKEWDRYEIITGDWPNEVILSDD